MEKVRFYIVFIWLVTFSMSCKEEKVSLPAADVDPSKILELVNEHRYGLGLAALRTNDVCQREATKHSENMANGSVSFGHSGSDNRFDIIVEQTGAVGFAENVAFGQKNAKEVVESWLSSPGHRENIEGDYSHIGIGIASDEDNRLFFTQIFAKIK